ncbi:7098_t:CDS:2 [Entrophospora sp. SA101]|nr:7098_t:CDS:2 [Entrophospora sp. SA101]
MGDFDDMGHLVKLDLILIFAGVCESCLTFQQRSIGIRSAVKMLIKFLPVPVTNTTTKTSEVHNL